MTRLPYLGVWCRVCEQDCLPLQDGSCGFCDTKVADRDGKPLAARDSSDDDDQDEQEATVEAKTCKREGCGEPVADRLGVYGGLCANHKQERRAQPTLPKPVRHGPKQPAVNPSVSKPKSLVELAQAVDDFREAYEFARAELLRALQ